MDQQGLIWTPSHKIKELEGTKKAVEIQLQLRNLLLIDSNLTLVRGNMEHFELVQNFWKNCGHRHHLSTGFYFVTNALNLCDHVHLYGFWPFNSSLDGRDIPVHYYDRGNISTGHDISNEFKLLLTMHRLGMLRFHSGDCIPKENSWRLKTNS